MRRRDLPVLEKMPVQKFTRHVPPEVISNPLNDVGFDPYDEGAETHGKLKNRQVTSFMLINSPPFLYISIMFHVLMLVICFYTSSS